MNVVSVSSGLKKRRWAEFCLVQESPAWLQVKAFHCKPSIGK